MFLVMRWLIPLGAYTELKQAHKAARSALVREIKAAVNDPDMANFTGHFEIWLLTINVKRRKSSSFPKLLGAYLQDDRGRVLYCKENDFQLEEQPDPVVQLAYDLLNKDPIALDIAQDVIAGRRK